MSHQRNQPPIVVSLRPSTWLDRAMAVLLVTVVGVAIAAPSVVLAAVAIGCAAILVVQWRATRAAVGPRGRVRRLECAGGGWWLQEGDGERIAAGLDGAPFVSVPLIVLAFVTAKGRRVIVLLPDSADRQALRRLRVLLRAASPAVAPQSDSPGGA